MGSNNPAKLELEAPAAKNADDAARKAAELPAALATAKAITETNDAINTPVPVLIGLLNTTIKAKFTWIKQFEARPKKLGHYSIHMIASDHEIDPDYTTGGAKGKEDLAGELGVKSEHIEHALKELPPEELRKLHGELDQELFNLLISPKRDLSVIRNFSKALELAGNDAVARKEIVEILRLTHKASVSNAQLQQALSNLVPFMERYKGRISGDFASRFRRAVQKNDPIQAQAELQLAEDILEGKTRLGDNRGVEGLADRSKERLQTPEYRVTRGNFENYLVEVKTINKSLSEEGIRRNVSKALSQIKEQAGETMEKGGFIRIDASSAPSSTMTPEDIHRSVKGEMLAKDKSGKKGIEIIQDLEVEVLYKDATGHTQKLNLIVENGDVVIAP